MKGNPPSEVMAAGAAEGTSQFSGILAATMSAVGGAVTSGGSTVMKLLGGREHGSEEDDDHEQGTQAGCQDIQGHDVDMDVSDEDSCNIVQDDEFRVTGQQQSQYEKKIRKLKSQVKDYAKQKAEQSVFTSNQNREVDRLKEELTKKNNRIAAIQQESRERELKLARGGAKSLSDGVDGEQDSTERRLRDHIKEQSKTIVELKETLEMTSTDKGSYDDLLQEAEEERDKLKEDFASARKETEALKAKVEDTRQQLASCKDEIRELELAKCDAISEIAVAKAEAEIYKADFLEERKDREAARGALEDMRKEKGGQDVVFNEEVAILHKKIDGVRQERDHLKKSFAGIEAKYRGDSDTARKVISNFRIQVETISKERDHWKYQHNLCKESIKKLEKITSDRDHYKHEYMNAKKQLEKITTEKHEAGQKKKSKTPVEREYKKMKEQLSRSVAANVSFSNELGVVRKELEKSKKEARDLLKIVRKAEKDKPKKGKTQPQGTSLPQELSNDSRADERDQIEILLRKVRDLEGQIKILEFHVATLNGAQKEQIGALSPTGSQKSLASPSTEQTTPASPSTEQGALASPTTEDFSIDSTFQNNPGYIHSELEVIDLKQQLDKGYAAAKQTTVYSSPQVPMEAGTGGFQQHQPGAKQPRNLTNPLLSHGDDNAAYPRRSGRLMEAERLAQPACNQRQGMNNPGLNNLSQDTQTSTSSHDQHVPKASSQQQGQCSTRDRLGVQANALPRSARPSSLQNQRGVQQPQSPGWHEGKTMSSQYQPLHARDMEEAVSQLPPKGKPLRARGPEDMVSSQPLHGQPLRAGGQEGFEPRPQPCQGNEFMSPQDPVKSTEECMPPLQSNLDLVSGGRPQNLPTTLGINLARPFLHERDGSQTPENRKTFPLANEQKRNEAKHATTVQSVDKQTSMDSGKVSAGVTLATQTSTPAQESLATQTPTEEKPAGGETNSKRKPSKKQNELELSATENRLVKKIDEEIGDMAAVVKREVSTDNVHKMTIQHSPFDPNLVCPMCGKKHRLGEIQKFRVHVDGCEGD